MAGFTPYSIILGVGSMVSISSCFNISEVRGTVIPAHSSHVNLAVGVPMVTALSSVHYW